VPWAYPSEEEEEEEEEEEGGELPTPIPPKKRGCEIIRIVNCCLFLPVRPDWILRGFNRKAIGC